MGADVVVARQVRYPAEFGVIGPPGPPEYAEDRQPDRDGDAREHAEQGDPGERRGGQQELLLALPPQPRHGRDIRQRQ